MGEDTSARLQALQKRRSDLDAVLRLEKEKRKNIERRNQERLIRILGRALVATASTSPDFEQMLKGVLRTTSLNETDRRFLESRNWL